MGFAIGSLLGGAAQGYGGGVDIASRLQAMRQAQHDVMAREAAGRMLGAGVPQPPMPGAPSMPMHPSVSPDPMMGNGPPPLGNTSPDSMMGGGPMPPPMAGMVPDGAPPLPGAPQSPMSSMAPPPAAPVAGPMGAGGAPLSGGQAGAGDPVTDAQHTIMNIAQQIKATNPNIRPEELFNATNLHIEQMKGVRNDVKDYMMQQIELAKVQARIQSSENRLRGVEDTASMNLEGRLGAADTRAGAARDVATTNAGARTTAAGISGKARTDAAATAAGARTTAATTTADASRDVAGTRAGATVSAAREGRAGKENAAGFQAGAAKPKLVGYDPQGNPIYVNAGAKGAADTTSTRAGTTTTPAKAGAYKSANDVKAAFQAGKLSQGQATTILRSQFGYQ